GDLRATLSLYGYCEGDPINKIDPTGEVAIPIKVAAGAAIAGVVFWIESRLGMRRWNLIQFTARVAQAAVTSAMGFGVFTHLARLRKVCAVAARSRTFARINNKRVNRIMTLSRLSSQGAVSSIGSSSGRHHGESWPRAIRRQFGW
ncbi:MAG: hypothetical protein FWE51_01775, partial [Coriobacteriia bacterium]|nr:hypothetical protein [Coriobacteriia bacterium]